MTKENCEIGSLAPAPMWRRALAAGFDALVAISSFQYAAIHWGEALPNGWRGWHGWEAAVALSLTGAYWVVPEWLFGCTLGKFICRLRVRSCLGMPATFVQALKRNLLRPIDFIFFYFIGFVVAMLNPSRQSLGDQWARTIVVPFRHEVSATLRQGVAEEAK